METRSYAHAVRPKPGERGFVLILLSMMILMLMIFGVSMISLAFGDIRAAHRSRAAMLALYLAESGIDQALVQLRQDYGWTGGTSSMDETGDFMVTVTDMGSDRRSVNSQGTTTQLGAPVSRSVEILVERQIPPDFYENVIWASRELDFRGNSYDVTGNVRHGDESPSSNTGGVDGPITYDTKTDPLPRLDFGQLYEIAEVQGNVYDAARLANGHGVFPTSFWFQPPTDPNDPTTGIPNINYITTDLVLNGNIGTIGGFFVVAGDVITDPTASEDTTINGNGQVAGAVYSRGNFRVNGGGNGLNVAGGIWAGNESRLNGNVTMAYNWDYMHAIEALNINPDVTVLSWEEVEQ